MTDARIRPFSNGSEYTAWQERNCGKCAKFDPDSLEVACPIDEALLSAYWDDGTISKEMADKIGFDGKRCHECKEQVCGGG